MSRILQFKAAARAFLVHGKHWIGISLVVTSAEPDSALHATRGRTFSFDSDAEVKMFQENNAAAIRGEISNETSIVYGVPGVGKSEL